MYNVFVTVLVCTSLSCHQHYTSHDPLVCTPELTPSSASRSASCFICLTCLHLVMFDSSMYLVPSVLTSPGRSMLNVTLWNPVFLPVFWNKLVSSCSSGLLLFLLPALLYQTVTVFYFKNYFVNLCKSCEPRSSLKKIHCLLGYCRKQSLWPTQVYDFYTL